MVDNVYKHAAPGVPFREMIDDPSLRGFEKHRINFLQEKVKDIEDILRQGYIGTPQVANPFYDNSINAKQFYENENGQSSKLRKDYDQFDKETEESRKNRQVEYQMPKIHEKYDWLSRRADKDLAMLRKEEKDLEKLLDEVRPFALPEEANLVRRRIDHFSQHRDVSDLQKQSTADLAKLKTLNRDLERCGRPEYRLGPLQVGQLDEQAQQFHNVAGRGLERMTVDEMVKMQAFHHSRLDELDHLKAKLSSKKLDLTEIRNKVYQPSSERHFSNPSN